jgi:hypothetical protein
MTLSGFPFAFLNTRKLLPGVNGTISGFEKAGLRREISAKETGLTLYSVYKL